MKINLKRRNRTDAAPYMGMLAVVLCIIPIFPLSALAGPTLKVDAARYSAGEVYAGEVVEHRFGISNVGDEALEVQRVRSSWGCTAALVSAETLQPGERTELLVRFNTRGMRGKVQRRVVVYSNDMEHTAVSLSIEAHIHPELEVKPPRFEIVRPSQGGERRVKLEMMNLSDRELAPLSVRTTVEGLKSEEKVPQTLAPGEQVTLGYSITFPPYGDAETHVRSGYIIVEAHGHGRSRERIPVLIQNPTRQD